MIKLAFSFSLAFLLLSSYCYSSDTPKPRRTFIKYGADADWTFNKDFKAFIATDQKKDYKERNTISFSLIVDSTMSLTGLKSLTNQDWQEGDKIKFHVFLMTKSLKDLGETYALTLPSSQAGVVFTKSTLTLLDLDTLKLNSLTTRIQKLKTLADQQGIMTKAYTITTQFTAGEKPADRQTQLASMRATYLGLFASMKTYLASKKIIDGDLQQEKELLTKKASLLDQTKDIPGLEATPAIDPINTTDTAADRKRKLDSITAQNMKLENTLSIYSKGLESIARDNQTQQALVDKLSKLKENLGLVGVTVDTEVAFQAYTSAQSEVQRQANIKDLQNLEQQWTTMLAKADLDNKGLINDNQTLTQKVYTLGTLRGKLEALTGTPPTQALDFFSENAKPEDRKTLLSKYDQQLESTTKQITDFTARKALIEAKNNELTTAVGTINQLKADLKTANIDSGTYTVPTAFTMKSSDEEIALALSGAEQQITTLRGLLPKE